MTSSLTLHTFSFFSSDGFYGFGSMKMQHRFRACIFWFRWRCNTDLNVVFFGSGEDAIPVLGLYSFGSDDDAIRVSGLYLLVLPDDALLGSGLQFSFRWWCNSGHGLVFFGPGGNSIPVLGLYFFGPVDDDLELVFFGSDNDAITVSVCFFLVVLMMMQYQSRACIYWFLMMQ